MNYQTPNPKKKIKHNSVILDNLKHMIYHQIIPLVNPKGQNNCFLNVLSQILFHIEYFNIKIRQIEFDLSEPNIKKNPIFHLKNFFDDYKKCQYSPIEYTLSIKYFRKALSNYFHEIIEGELGDPVETFNYILNSIHLYNANKDFNTENPSSFSCNKCLAHELFSMNIKDRIYCTKCNKEKSNKYDSNYFVFEIFIFEILEEIHNQSSESYRNQLFSISKTVNKFIEHEIRIDGCLCKNPEIEKEAFICNENKPYFVINITWDRPIPKMTDVCKVFNLIPLYDYNGRLLSFEKNANLNTIYYLYAIVLFYNGHYTCAINKGNNWYFIEDVKIKEFKSYKDLVFDVIKNYYHPVMLFYINNLNTNSTIDNNQVFSKEDFKRVYNNCYEIDVRKGENVSIHGSKNCSLINNELQFDNLGKNNNEKTNKDNSLHKKNNSFTLLTHDSGSLINDKENPNEESNELNISDDKIGEVYIDSYNKNKNNNNNNNNYNNEDEESSSFIIYNDDEYVRNDNDKTNITFKNLNK